MTSDPALAGWLQLTLTPGLGAATIRKLLLQFGLPEKVLAASRPELAPIMGTDALRALDSHEVSQAVEQALAWLGLPGNAIVTLADEAYPRLLLEIADPPPILYCRGRTELLNRPALALVGSRNATAQGTSTAELFGRSFSVAGLTIVSGLAQGIDAAAHRGGLAGEGSTIAVLGTGADLVYPRGNATLAAEIADRGLLLSEFALGTKALAHNFPRRNRLISGLTQGCLVIEAALASGSLITARAAAEQGREVFAVPGSIHSPLSKGCHELIKSGAKLVETAEDVLAELAAIRRTGFATTRASAPAPSTGRADEPLLVCMGFDPVDVDSLCARAKLPAETVSAELLQLELAGRVAVLPGGLYQRLS
ncbi:MAG: DNA-protecting protein DprA [Candidatus Parcubacteria bacterium]|nr:DNA-protecting protein DprA [Burkholderiales bacterium]